MREVSLKDQVEHERGDADHGRRRHERAELPDETLLQQTEPELQGELPRISQVDERIDILVPHHEGRDDGHRDDGRFWRRIVEM